MCSTRLMFQELCVRESQEQKGHDSKKRHHGLIEQGQQVSNILTDGTDCLTTFYKLTNDTARVQLILLRVTTQQEQTLSVSSGHDVDPAAIMENSY